MSESGSPTDAGRVAVVTGGSSVIGGGVCEHLARRGFDVAVHHHTGRDRAERIASKVVDTGRRAVVIEADLAGEAGALALRDAVSERFGSLDLLVNAAGAYHQRAFLDLSEAEWFAELNTTATAVYFTTRSLLPLLRRTRGRVINVGDGECTTPGARHLAPGYHVGKCGVWLLTRSFAAHEAEHGVAVNMLSPGLMENSQGLGSPDVVPAGRFGTPADVAAALDMLLAADAPYVTGSNVVVGGGWNL